LDHEAQHLEREAELVGEGGVVVGEGAVEQAQHRGKDGAVVARLRRAPRAARRVLRPQLIEQRGGGGAQREGEAVRALGRPGRRGLSLLPAADLLLHLRHQVTEGALQRAQQVRVARQAQRHAQPGQHGLQRGVERGVDRRAAA